MFIHGWTSKLSLPYVMLKMLYKLDKIPDFYV